MLYEQIVIEDGLEYKVTQTEDWSAWTYGGKLHRIKGPAVIGIAQPQKKAWWYLGTRVECQSQEEFEKRIKLMMFW